MKYIFVGYMITVVIFGMLALYEIEKYQLERDCIEYGWTYCIRK